VGVSSNVVLTSSANFDPTALAISDNGQVATVGFNFYAVGANDVVLTGDELGRFLQPVGMARIVPAGYEQLEAKISVAMPSTGEIAAVALDFNGSRFFTDTYGATPATLLAQLCASSSRAITAAEWQTYFPGEPYTPACASAAPMRALDVTPPAVLPQIAVPVRRAPRRRTVGQARREPTPRSGSCVPQAVHRDRLELLAVVTRPTYCRQSPPHSSVHTAAKASVT
jgi:hypothetical protein